VIPYVPGKPVRGGIERRCPRCGLTVFEHWDEFDDGRYRAPDPTDEPLPPPFVQHWLVEHAERTEQQP
jgi:hypothetical protein